MSNEPDKKAPSQNDLKEVLLGLLDKVRVSEANKDALYLIVHTEMAKGLAQGAADAYGHVIEMILEILVNGPVMPVVERSQQNRGMTPEE